ncbi:unnamed protein product [Prunus armeniaca]
METIGAIQCHVVVGTIGAITHCSTPCHAAVFTIERIQKEVSWNSSIDSTRQLIGLVSHAMVELGDGKNFIWEIRDMENFEITYALKD